jgi:hypothetical protein
VNTDCSGLTRRDEFWTKFWDTATSDLPCHYLAP